MKVKLGFIGGGNMAGSLIGGLIQSNAMSVDDIMVFEPSAERAQQLKSDFDIKLADDNQQLVQHSDVIIIAVKPQVLQTVLQPLANAFTTKQPLIISIVAGILSGSIENWLGQQHAIVRVMPNTPALVGYGASGLYANKRVTPEQKDITDTLLNSVGITAWVNAESDIDSVTALSGSGPAYFMLFIKSLVESAQAAGLDEATAKQLAVATARGSAELIENSDDNLETLINNVTSPGGTTEQAILSFNSSNLAGIVTTAFEAARRRSEELAEQLGKAI